MQARDNAITSGKLSKNHEMNDLDIKDRTIPREACMLTW